MPFQQPKPRHPVSSVPPTSANPLDLDHRPAGLIVPNPSSDKSVLVKAKAQAGKISRTSTNSVTISSIPVTSGQQSPLLLRSSYGGLTQKQMKVELEKQRSYFLNLSKMYDATKKQLKATVATAKVLNDR
jgi:hypothetical protein